MLLKKIILLVNYHFYQAVLPHLLLLEETKGLQLVLVFTLIIQLELKYLIEKILHGTTKLKSASPTNIDIGFKSRGLKWKGKHAINTSQLQQMKANKKNKGSCGTSKK
uniref:Uncharacterized protein n=1 Tax=Solanum tuberosum TaxID=4113 RepID=M1A520_SOLTU